MIDSLNLSGRTYLVTGAASGMGRATSILLSGQGARIVLVDINKEGLYNTQQQCTGETYVLEMDLSKPESFKGKVHDTILEFGRLNGFIHCAGIPYISHQPS